MIHKEASIVSRVEEAFCGDLKATLTNGEIRELLRVNPEERNRISTALHSLMKHGVVKAVGKRSKELIYQLTGNDVRVRKIKEHKPKPPHNGVTKSRKGLKIDPNAPSRIFRTAKTSEVKEVKPSEVKRKKVLRFKEKVLFADIYGICPHCQGHFAFSFSKV